MSTQSYISRGTGVCLSRWLRFVVLPTSSAACSRASPRVRTNFSTSEGNVMKSRSGILCVLLGALALSACGGGANIEFEDQLKADLAESQAEVTRLTQELTDALETARQATKDATAASRAATAAEMRATEAEQRADDAEAARDEDVARYRQEAEDAKAAAETARQEAATAQAQADAAQQQAQQAQQQAQQAQQEVEEAQQQAQTREANQRAERLKAAFLERYLEIADSTNLTTVSQTDSPVAIAAERGRLRLTRGGFRDATLSGNGLRTATMDLTSGSDSGKTVVYTDRELSRPLLVHYGDQRNSMDETQLDVSGTTDTVTAVGLEAIIEQNSSGSGTTGILATSTKWKISSGRAASVAGVDTITDDPDTARDEFPPAADLPANAESRSADSFPGTLYGQSGSFVCRGTGCKVQVTPNYETAGDGKTSFALVSIGVGVTGTDATLHFKPSGSPTLQLYEDGPVGDDSEYMVFGYWREDPTSAAADYQVDVFAEAFDTTDSQAVVTADITATYDGTAVGMYVEQDPNNAVDTHRQGEFTADVFLEISNDSPDTISGTIDDFETTPTGGSAEPRTSARWVVELNAGTTAPTGSDAGGVAEIKNLSGVSSGSWEATLVHPHQYAADDTPLADPANTIPPAVTGIFNTRLLNFVHLIGAFGAERR